MPKNNSEITNLDEYFNRPDVQEETKNFVKKNENQQNMKMKAKNSKVWTYLMSDKIIVHKLKVFSTTHFLNLIFFILIY
ncbi:MAG: hypothetical protein REH79_02730 [Spiroplasma sp.]|nr:hypothetical protein [Spiroplasma sp.]